MDFKEYQILTRKQAVYPLLNESPLYPVLGLVGEAGEVSEKVKKIWRDHNMQITDGDRVAIGKELGDVLWYVANAATEFGLDLDSIAVGNIEKINKRIQTDTLHGEGDDREVV